MKRNRIQVKPLKVGQKIYVDTNIYLSEGSRDVSGGIATVVRVFQQKYLKGIWFVEVKEHPGRGYNWTQILSNDQAKLKKEFGNRIAHVAPDIDTPWIEKGDNVGLISDPNLDHEGSPIW